MHRTIGLFGRALAPAPSAVPAGALPNVLEVERLRPVICEVEQWLYLQEGRAGGAKKNPAPPALAPAPPFLQGARAPNGAYVALWVDSNKNSSIILYKFLNK